MTGCSAARNRLDPKARLSLGIRLEDGAVSEAHHAADAALEALETLEAADTTFLRQLVEQTLLRNK